MIDSIMTKLAYRAPIAGYLKGLLARLQGKGLEKTEDDNQGLLKRPDRLDVIQAFRLILGREPEEEAIQAHLDVTTVAELRRLLLTSEEFSGKYRAMHPDVSDHPNLNRSRRAIVFIHLLKTGGTSLREIIGRQFPRERRCPILENNLHVLTVAELSRYDFFAGHFDISCKAIIPRDEIDVVALFREPRSRLISLYRFLRAHPSGDEFAEDSLIPLAHQLSAEEFFERPEIRIHPTINNHYLFALGRSFWWFDHHRGSLNDDKLSAILPDAKLQISALKALGLTERFSDSAHLICCALGLATPSAIDAVHVTDEFPDRDARFRHVQAVQMSPRLDEAMQDLIKYDASLYEFAASEFERRLKDVGTETRTAEVPGIG